MSVSPFPTVVTRAWRGLLLLLCLLAAAGCAARGRPAAVPTATAPPTLSPLTPTPTATPTLPRTAVSTPKSTATPRPTFTPTATPRPTFTPTETPRPTFTPTLTLTPSVQVEGVYANLEVHPGGRYRLRRRGNLVEAELVSTSSAVQHAARQQPQVLFTLPPAFRPPFPVLRRVVGQPVLADGSLDPASPDPRPFRLQIAPDGAVRYLDHPEVAELGYLAYALHLTWGTTAAANDLAVLQILGEVTAAGDIRVPDRVEFADGRLTELTKYGLTGELPPELGQLSHLQFLQLVWPMDQGLVGPIPPSWANSTT